MPLIPLLRALFGLVSLTLLATAAYLLWTWFHGQWVPDGDQVLRFERDERALWAGAALLAVSLLGRFPLLALLARRDSEPIRAVRGDGRMIPGAQGASLYVEESGPEMATPIILTHGWSLDSTIWFYARRALAKRFRVIVWDLPGLGRSTRGDGEVSLSGMADNLERVIDLAGGRPALLVGHSIGGMIIQTLARDRPAFFAERVSGVVLLNTTHTNPLRTMILSRIALALRWPLLEPMMRLTIVLQPLIWLSGWINYLSGASHLAVRFGFGRQVTRSQLEHVTLLLTRNPPATSARGDLAMFRWDSAMALADAGKPLLVIGGTMDIVTVPEAGAAIAQATPGARFEAVEGVNHMGFLERADEYHRAIEDFAETMPA